MSTTKLFACLRNYKTIFKPSIQLQNELNKKNNWVETVKSYKNPWNTCIYLSYKLEYNQKIFFEIRKLSKILFTYKKTNSIKSNISNTLTLNNMKN